MRSKFFVILGNQLFNPKILKKNGCSEVFMAEDFGLCTYFKHHKLKLYLFLAGMREYRDELQNDSISVNYLELSSRNKGESYVDSLIKFLKKKKLSEINIFEIEDKSFEQEFLKALKDANVTVNIFKSPMFIFERNEFPRPSPSEAPLTKPAISTKSKTAGIIFSEFTILFNSSSLLSGRGTMPTFGSIVQNGKFSACALLEFFKALNKVDLPTFGNPTIPHLKPI